MSRLQNSNRKELSDLLCRLFSVAELRRHIRLDPQLQTLHNELLEGHVSVAEMASDVTELAERHGITGALFEMIRTARPGQAKELEAVSALFQPVLYELNTPKSSRSDSYGKWFSMRLRLGPLKVVIALSIFMAALGVTVQSLSIGGVPSIQVLQLLSAAENESRDLFPRYAIPWATPLPKESWPLMAIRLGDSDKINAEWCTSVFGSFRKMAEDRYPFRQRSTKDVEIGDFGTLFHPDNGAITAFRDQYLAGFLERAGDRVVARALGPSSSLHLDKRVVDFFDSALRLGLIVYPSREFGFDLNVRFSCMVKEPAYVSIIVNGTAYTSSHCMAESRLLIHWPGKDVAKGAILETKGKGNKIQRIEKPGAFGLFRLFESGKWHQSVRNMFDVTFATAIGDLSMRVNLPSFSRDFVEKSDAAHLSILAPFRRVSLMDPPQALFIENPYFCKARAAIAGSQP